MYEAFFPPPILHTHTIFKDAVFLDMCLYTEISLINGIIYIGKYLPKRLPPYSDFYIYLKGAILTHRIQCISNTYSSISILNTIVRCIWNAAVAFFTLFTQVAGFGSLRIHNVGLLNFANNILWDSQHTGHNTRVVNLSNTWFCPVFIQFLMQQQADWSTWNYCCTNSTAWLQKHST